MSDEPIVRLSRFRADVSRALARRGKGIMEAPDLREQVQALEPLEAYFIVKETGVEDALPLLHAATGEQLQAFVDLDCWSEERPDPIEIDAWLAPFLALGPEALADAFHALDPELQVLFVGSGLVIHDARSEAVPEQAVHVPRMTTPDTFFVLDERPGEERELDPFVLVNALYAHDVEDTFRLLTAANWESESLLEEEALRFRQARLQELGFPTREEALRLFAPPPAEPPPRHFGPPAPTSLPALYAQPLSQATLLTRALARVADPEALDAIERDLVYLVNAALVAYGETPRDLAHVGAIAARVRDTVSLGLEAMLAPGDRPLAFPEGEQAAEDAAQLLARWPARGLFQRGFQEVLPLAGSARALAADPIVSAWLARLETEREDYGPDRLDRELLRGLTAERPLYGGFDRLQPTLRKAFASRAELAEAEARLDAIARRLA